MIVGVTGGIGCGKSAVLNILKEKYGAHIIKADDVAAKLMTGDAFCINQLKSAFGDEFYLEDGSLNKEFISNKIYSDEYSHELIDGIVHPMVRKVITDEVCQVRARLIVIEAALLLEAGYEDMCDEVWYIYCERSERVKRLKESRNMSDERIKSIMSAQLTEDEFKRRTDKLINNSFDLEFTQKEIQRVLVWG